MRRMFTTVVDGATAIVKERGLTLEVDLPWNKTLTLSIWW